MLKAPLDTNIEQLLLDNKRFVWAYNFLDMLNFNNRRQVDETKEKCRNRANW